MLISNNGLETIYELEVPATYLEGPSRDSSCQGFPSIKVKSFAFMDGYICTCSDPSRLEPIHSFMVLLDRNNKWESVDGLGPLSYGHHA